MHAATVRVGGWTERTLLPKCHARVVLSRAKQHEIAAAYGMEPARFHVVPAGVDQEVFSPASRSERLAIRERLGLPRDAFVYLFVGRFSPEKNPGGLLDAFSRMASQQGTVLAMVGPGEDALRADVLRLGLSERVIMPGKVLQPLDWYRAADVFVLPSLSEGFGQVLLEAMACGLPVVAFRPPPGSHVLATEEVVVHDRTGLLVTYGDTGALGEAMLWLAANRAQAAAMGLAAIERCRAHFSWTVVVERLLALSHNAASNVAAR
jgi:D-inositol-3-phosphate glycosyltransferase